MDQEPNLDTLKQEVEELRAVTEDTNRQVHKMQRRARWSFFFQIVWWLSVLGITGAAYYYYVQPYVQKIENLYLGAQQGAQQAQGWQDQLKAFFDKYFSQPSSPTSPSTQQ